MRGSLTQILGRFQVHCQFPRRRSSFNCLEKGTTTDISDVLQCFEHGEANYLSSDSSSRSLASGRRKSAPGPRSLDTQSLCQSTTVTTLIVRYWDAVDKRIESGDIVVSRQNYCVMLQTIMVHLNSSLTYAEADRKSHEFWVEQFKEIKAIDFQKFHISMVALIFSRYPQSSLREYADFLRQLFAEIAKLVVVYIDGQILNINLCDSGTMQRKIAEGANIEIIDAFEKYLPLLMTNSKIRKYKKVADLIQADEYRLADDILEHLSNSVGETNECLTLYLIRIQKFASSSHPLHSIEDLRQADSILLSRLQHKYVNSRGISHVRQQNEDLIHVELEKFEIKLHHDPLTFKQALQIYKSLHMMFCCSFPESIHALIDKNREEMISQISEYRSSASSLSYSKLVILWEDCLSDQAKKKAKGLKTSAGKWIAEAYENKDILSQYIEDASIEIIPCEDLRNTRY